MKILATSDMHGNLEGIDLSGIDIAIFAGDIAPLKGRGPWHIYDQVKWINKNFNDFCKKWSDTKIIFVPGNHDFFPIIKEIIGHKLHGKDLSLKLAPNATMLIDKLIEVGGLKIYGTPWVPIISYSWAFEAESDELNKKFDSIPEGLDILVTHSPPHISHDNTIDRSTQFRLSDAYGSSELANAIFKKKPKFVFCGHIHSGNHEKIIFNESIIYNVARVDERYEIAYEPLLIEV